jgi:DNA polymerase
MNKQKKLELVAKEIKNCKICKQGKIGKPVPGEGNPDAKVVFLGEAPGRTEAETGRPFVGRSGQLLRGKIRDIGLNESEVFITSPVKYLPKKGTPSKSDIAHGKIHLSKQLGIINPQFIVLLGNTAAIGVLEKKFPAAKWHGKTIKKDDKTYFFSFHPAAAIRFPQIRKCFIKDMSKFKKILGESGIISP